VHSRARDCFASAALQDQHKEFCVADCIDNSIVPFTNAIELFLAVEHLHSGRTRSIPKGVEPFDDEFLKRFGEGFELSLSRRSEKECGNHRKESDPKS
jgi:hypothetical protein